METIRECITVTENATETVQYVSPENYTVFVGGSADGNFYLLIKY